MQHGRLWHTNEISGTIKHPTILVASPFDLPEADIISRTKAHLDKLDGRIRSGIMDGTPIKSGA